MVLLYNSIYVEFKISVSLRKFSVYLFLRLPHNLFYRNILRIFTHKIWKPTLQMDGSEVFSILGQAALFNLLTFLFLVSANLLHLSSTNLVDVLATTLTILPAARSYQPGWRSYLPVLYQDCSPTHQDCSPTNQGCGPTHQDCGPT